MPVRLISSPGATGPKPKKAAAFKTSERKAGRGRKVGIAEMECGEGGLPEQIRDQNRRIPQ